MPKRKISNKSKAFKEETNPLTAKIVLFIFGIGPVLLMIGFLASKGFF